MEGTSSQSAAILQSPHPSRLVCTFPACPVGCLTLSSKECPRSLVSAKLIDNYFFYIFLLCSGASSGGVSPTRKEQPLFTLRQVGIICERLLKEREEKVREEYEETMTSKLAGWYAHGALLLTGLKSLWFCQVVGFISLAEFQVFIPKIPSQENN